MWLEQKKTDARILNRKSNQCQSIKLNLSPLLSFPMIEILHNESLKPYNTFGIDVRAHLFCEINSLIQLTELLTDKELSRQPLLLLGGGSNVLFTGDVSGLVLKISMKGREIVSQDNDIAIVRAAAGENWDEFVAWTLEQGLSGLENLSLIPGNVGSSPIQNIGAYGVELQDCLKDVEIIHLAGGKRQVLENKECHFGYRNSIFKQELRGKVIIVSVSFTLNKKHNPHLTYGSISRELAEAGIMEPGPAEIRGAVCRIRKSKLPDPKVLGNAGSFFKNPTVSFEIHNLLSAKFTDIPAYPNDNGTYKLAAGWLIEQCGWKGVRRGDAGVHTAQALVLVNYGSASGSQLLALASEIQESVSARFGVHLETEVNIL
jgi:UDP-N-acetylmuramate dehydrogenase